MVTILRWIEIRKSLNNTQDSHFTSSFADSLRKRGLLRITCLAMTVKVKGKRIIGQSKGLMTKPAGSLG